MKSSARLKHISLRQTSSLPKHIVFVHYYFPPMGGGGVQRLTKFLKYFDYEKYDVSILTVKSSFFYSNDPSLLKEIPDRVRVLRSGSLDPFRLLHFYQLLRTRLRSLPRSFSSKSKISDKTDRKVQPHSESANRIRRLSMAFFVPDSRILWLPFALGKLWQLNRINRIDLIVASMPPFTAGLIGILFQQWMKIPAILDFRDAWTNNPYFPEVGSINKSLNERLERYCVGKAAGALFVNPVLRKYYEKKYARLADKPLSTIRNGFDPDDFDFLSKVPKSIDAAVFILGIMGTIYSQGNRPISLLKAINELLAENPGFKHKFKLVFLGKWSSDFLELIERYELGGNIELIGYMPHQEALKRAAEFDALSLSIESNFPGSKLVTPGRIYEYLRLKKPILALCPLESDLAFLIREHRAGEAIEFDDVQKIRSVLKNWIDNRPSFSERFEFRHLERVDRSNLTRQLIEFLENFN